MGVCVGVQGMSTWRGLWGTRRPRWGGGGSAWHRLLRLLPWRLLRLLRWLLLPRSGRRPRLLLLLPGAGCNACLLLLLLLLPRGTWCKAAGKQGMQRSAAVS